MGDWFTMQTILAFFLGVLASAMVKNAASSLKSKL